ncbi:MAG: tetratricopeptide repeat protein [Pseudomonadota bacterium]
MLLPALSLFLLLFTGPPAHAQKQVGEEENEKALALYKKAVDYAKKEKWQEALDLFIESSELSAPPVVHYNIARCLESLGRFEEAAESYEKYVEEADPPAKERKEVEEKISSLNEKPSRLTIMTTPKGADVIKKEGGKETYLGKTPYKTMLDAGMHIIALRKEGYRGKKLKIKACCAKTFHIKTNLEHANGAPAAPEDEGEEEVMPLAPGEEEPEEPGEEEKPDQPDKKDKKDEDEVKEKGKKPSPTQRNIGLVLEAGGGGFLHIYRNVDLAFSGNFSVDVHKILGRKPVHGGVGIQLGGVFYDLEDSGGSAYSTMLLDVLVSGQLRFQLHRRVVLMAALSLGASFLQLIDDVPADADFKLLGGAIEGSSIPFFAAGIAVALRVNIVSGFHVVLRPADVLLLVPFSELPGDNKVLPRYGVALLLGWEF